VGAGGWALHHILGGRLVFLKGEERGPQEEAFTDALREEKSIVLREVEDAHLVLVVHEQGQEVARARELCSRKDQARTAQGTLPEDRAGLGPEAAPQGRQG
jgi:hypothetical protein